MNSRKGNSSRLKKAEDRTAANEKLWKRTVKSGPYSDVQTVYEIEPSFKGTIKGQEVRDALEYVSRITSDPVFESAAKALSAYGFATKGLKQTAKRLLREAGRTALDTLALKMLGGDRIEAEETVARYGPKGQSFETLVRELMRARKAFETRVKKGTRLRTFSDGATGNFLLVRFACLQLGPENRPLKNLFGCRFDNFGFAVVPDNRNWRREITAGRICSFGALPGGDTRDALRKRARLRMERRKAWKNLQEFSHGKS